MSVVAPARRVLRVIELKRGEGVRVEQDPPGMGVLFRELNGYSKDLIEKLLTKRPG